jgi:predicted HTH transcriptional regulator
LVLREGEGYELYGKLLCEDCYMYVTDPPRTCDPTAVASALSVRRQLGQSGVEGLTELQRKIYRLIEEKGKISKEELAAALELSPAELESQFAVLRHCELVRAFKEEGKIYLTKW